MWTLQHAFRVGWEPAYSELVLEGWLANDLPLWGQMATPARARVRDPHQTPYITESAAATLAAVLSDEWPHDELLGALG